MDTLAHALYGAAVVAPTRNEKMMLAAAISGMMPDLVVQGASIVQMGLVEGLKFMGGAGLGYFPENLIILYRYSHSLFFPLIAFILLLIFKRKWAILVVPYFLHILFDIPTHCGIFATRILYPLLDFNTCGFNYATNLWAWEANYGLIIGIYYLIYLKWYKPYLKV